MSRPRVILDDDAAKRVGRGFASAFLADLEKRAVAFIGWSEAHRRRTEGVAQIEELWTAMTSLCWLLEVETDLKAAGAMDDAMRGIVDSSIERLIS